MACNPFYRMLYIYRTRKYHWEAQKATKRILIRRRGIFETAGFCINEHCGKQPEKVSYYQQE
jgi:hypothetical protein